jgi:hypothetical protein
MWKIAGYEFGSQMTICVTFMSYKIPVFIRYYSVTVWLLKIYAGRRKQLKNKNTFVWMLAVYQANTSLSTFDTRTIQQSNQPFYE